MMATVVLLSGFVIVLAGPPCPWGLALWYALGGAFVGMAIVMYTVDAIMRRRLRR